MKMHHRLNDGKRWQGAGVIHIPRRMRTLLDFVPFGGGVEDGVNGLWHLRPSKTAIRSALLAVSPDTRASRLAGCLAVCVWIKSETAYRVQPNQAEEFQAWYNLGWDVSLITGKLIPPRKA